MKKTTSAMQAMARSLFAALVVASGTASAYTLSFSPSAQSVVLGNQATVEVRITGILPNPPTIDGELDGLGNYDFDLVYDPAIIRYAGASDGFSLGLAIGLGVTPDWLAGRLNVSDFSLEPSPADLLAAQSDELLLFTLFFDSVATGSSALVFSSDEKDITLGSVEGNPRMPSATGGSIEVRAAPMPEPGTLALLAGAGLIFVASSLALRGFREIELFRRRRGPAGLTPDRHQRSWLGQAPRIR